MSADPQGEILVGIEARPGLSFASELCVRRTAGSLCRALLPCAGALAAAISFEYWGRAVPQRTNSGPHLSGTLYDHLLGTAYLLAQRCNPRHVCVTGMFHSIYGTRDFRAQTLQQDSRPVIRELLGAEAELLVHLFSSCNRRSFYRNLVGSGPAIVQGKDDKPVEVGRTLLPASRGDQRRSYVSG